MQHKLKWNKNKKAKTKTKENGTKDTIHYKKKKRKKSLLIADMRKEDFNPIKNQC